MIDSNSSAEIISSNQDLLIQILIRLPAKPLIRFKSISKRWFSLISCRQFCSLHTLQNPNKTTSGLFLRKSFQEFQFLSYENSKSSKSVPPFTSLDFTNDPAGIKILQSCNGLLLCSSLFTMGTTRRYYIYNPTTKQFSTLPTILDATSSTILGMNLAFDPSISFHYKVICIRSMPTSIYYHQIVEYYSQVGSWHVCGSPFVGPHDMVFDNGVFWNGAMHWIGTAGNVMCYNVDRQCFVSMPKRPFLEGRGKKKCRYFGESGGHLFLIEFYGSCASNFKVFEMEKDSSEWDVMCQVDLSHVLQEFPEMARSHHAFVVLCVVRGEGEEGSPLVLLHIPGKVICYDLKEKTCKKVYELGICGNSNKGSLQFGWFDAYPFVENLACV